VLGLAWPIAFVVGAVISPPDAVAPLSIARGLGLPKQIVAILDGEGLVNDATALILYRFAIAAVGAGSFSLGHAVGAFGVIVMGEIVWGFAIGWAMLRLRRWIADPRIEIMLSVLTPFLAYWPPEHLGGSGVLATVVTGLYFSRNGPKLISAATRLQGVFFWNFLTYLIEGMVFLLTGLQAHQLLAAISLYPASELALSAAIVCLVVVGARFAWIFPATYLPRWVSPSLRRAAPIQPWQGPFVLAFAGIRGVVSLAAALAIPVTTANGAPFPHRDLVLFLAFCVILVTLVGQGLLLPFVIRWLGLDEIGQREQVSDRAEELDARRQAIEASLKQIRRLADTGQLATSIALPIFSRHQELLLRADKTELDEADDAATPLDSAVEASLVAVERAVINDLHAQGRLNDQGRRRIERGLDLRQAYLVSHGPED
jgi:CPA1 family monovalent cation:H+ antiporter